MYVYICHLHEGVDTDVQLYVKHRTLPYMWQYRCLSYLDCHLLTVEVCISGDLVVPVCIFIYLFKYAANSVQLLYTYQVDR